jgi:predicted DNA-binding protein (MmcQ/YjbR family)
VIYIDGIFFLKFTTFEININNHYHLSFIKSMDANEILDYCLAKKGVTETFPFDNETLVMKVGTKMFLLMGLERQPLSINVKTDPEWSAELREQHPQITGAFHMNKTHWNSVMVDGLKRDLIYKLIDQSYELVFNSLTKKAKEEIINS